MERQRMKLLSGLLLPLCLGGRGSAGGTGAGPPSGLFTGFARGRDRACLPPPPPPPTLGGAQ